MASWDERMPHEPVKAYNYFLDYLNLGLNRSIPKVVDKKEKTEEKISIRTLRRYADKYEWVRRAEEYDILQAEQKQLKLQQETDEYFELKRKELESYEGIYQAITASIVEGIMDGSIDPLKASRALKTLTEANIDVSKLHLRLFGEPAEIQQINTQQDVQVESNEGFDILDNDWMNNELEIMKKLIDKD